VGLELRFEQFQAALGGLALRRLGDRRPIREHAARVEKIRRKHRGYERQQQQGQ